MALWDRPKGQNRIWHTDRLSRQTAECFPGRRHIWKNWVLAYSCLQRWLSLFFGTRGKHLGAFVVYNALSSAAETKEGRKREMFPADTTTPAHLPLVSILLTWPTHHLAPGAFLFHTNQDHESLAPGWHADLLFLTNFSSQTYKSFYCIFRMGAKLYLLYQV